MNFTFSKFNLLKEISNILKKNTDCSKNSKMPTTDFSLPFIAIKEVYISQINNYYQTNYHHYYYYLCFVSIVFNLEMKNLSLFSFFYPQIQQ